MPYPVNALDGQFYLSFFKIPSCFVNDQRLIRTWLAQARSHHVITMPKLDACRQFTLADGSRSTDREMPTTAGQEDPQENPKTTLDSLFDDDDVDVVGNNDPDMMQLDDPHDLGQKDIDAE